jgi:hypothetical protein
MPGPVWTLPKTKSEARGVDPNRSVLRRARNKLVQNHQAEFDQYVAEERMRQGINTWKP